MGAPDDLLAHLNVLQKDGMQHLTSLVDSHKAALSVLLQQAEAEILEMVQPFEQHEKPRSKRRAAIKHQEVQQREPEDEGQDDAKHVARGAGKRRHAGSATARGVKRGRTSKHQEIDQEDSDAEGTLVCGEWGRHATADELDGDAEDQEQQLREGHAHEEQPRGSLPIDTAVDEASAPAAAEQQPEPAQPAPRRSGRARTTQRAAPPPTRATRSRARVKQQETLDAIEEEEPCGVEQQEEQQPAAAEAAKPVAAKRRGAAKGGKKAAAGEEAAEKEAAPHADVKAPPEADAGTAQREADANSPAAEPNPSKGARVKRIVRVSMKDHSQQPPASPPLSPSQQLHQQLQQQQEEGDRFEPPQQQGGEQEAHAQEDGHQPQPPPSQEPPEQQQGQEHFMQEAEEAEEDGQTDQQQQEQEQQVDERPQEEEDPAAEVADVEDAPAASPQLHNTRTRASGIRLHASQPGKSRESTPRLGGADGRRRTRASSQRRTTAASHGAATGSILSTVLAASAAAASTPVAAAKAAAQAYGKGKSLSFGAQLQVPLSDADTVAAASHGQAGPRTEDEQDGQEVDEVGDAWEQQQHEQQQHEQQQHEQQQHEQQQHEQQQEQQQADENQQDGVRDVSFGPIDDSLMPQLGTRVERQDAAAADKMPRSRQGGSAPETPTAEQSPVSFNATGLGAAASVPAGSPLMTPVGTVAEAAAAAAAAAPGTNRRFTRSAAKAFLGGGGGGGGAQAPASGEEESTPIAAAGGCKSFSAAAGAGAGPSSCTDCSDAAAAGAPAPPDGSAANVGANLVSGIRSFLPSFMQSKKGSPQIAAGKAKIKVKALEAAQAARKAEEARVADKARQREAAAAKAPVAAAAPVIPAAAAVGKPKASRVPVAAEQGEEEGVGLQQTPVGAMAATKLAAVDKAAAGQAGSGSGGAVRVPVAQPKSGDDDGAKRPAVDKEAAKRKAERDAEAAKKAVEKQEREERAKRVEAKRRDDEARRRAELEEKQRAKDERMANRRQQLAATGGGNGGPGGAARPGAGAAQRPPPGGGALQGPAKELRDAAAKAAPTRPLLAAASTPGGSSMRSPVGQATMLQPVHGPAGGGGGEGGSQNPGAVDKALMPPPTAHKTPVAPPVSDQERHNIEMLKSSPYVNMGSKRTPKLALPNPHNYEISPYRDDEEATPDRSGKPIPEWARSHNLGSCLQRQQHVDPDKVFGAKQTSCPLDDIFKGVELLPNSQPLRPKKRQLHQRTSSGDWSRDKVTWSEEIAYKKAMGYV